MTSTRIERILILATCLLMLGAFEARVQAASDMLIIDQYTEEDMEAFQAIDKFAEDTPNGYPGLPNKGIARRLNRAMNTSLDILMTVAKEDQSRTAVVNRVRNILEASTSLGLPESEQDRIIWCYYRAMEIMRIEVEDGQFEIWVYGSASRR